MSNYESHSGKLRIVEPKENETLDQLKKRIWCEKSGNKEEDYEVKGNLSDDYYDEFFEVNGKLWEVLDHEEMGDEDDMFCRLHDNKDGTFSFHTRFYNGGTCMSEMVTEELEKLDPKTLMEKSWFKLTFTEKLLKAHSAVFSPEEMDKNKRDFVIMIIESLIDKTKGMTNNEIDKLLGKD